MTLATRNRTGDLETKSPDADQSSTRKPPQPYKKVRNM